MTLRGVLTFLSWLVFLIGAAGMIGILISLWNGSNYPAIVLLAVMIYFFSNPVLNRLIEKSPK